MSISKEGKALLMQSVLSGFVRIYEAENSRTVLLRAYHEQCEAAKVVLSIVLEEEKEPEL